MIAEVLNLLNPQHFFCAFCGRMGRKVGSISGNTEILRPLYLYWQSITGKSYTFAHSI